MTNNDNLTTTFLQNLMNKNNQTPIIVLWNGKVATSKLLRLWTQKKRVLNITAHDNNNDKQLFLKITDYYTKQVYYEVGIGFWEKNGRFFSLAETHAGICGSKHKGSLHDPCFDVKLTKCIFDFLMKRVGFKKFIKM